MKSGYSVLSPVVLYLCLAVLACRGGGAALGASLGGGQLDPQEPYNPLDEPPLSAAWLTQYLQPLPPIMASQPQKRRPISVNQDLMSISRMLGGGSGRGNAARAQSFLDSIGKRSSGVYVVPSSSSSSSSSSSDFYRERRGGHQLSVGMPLRTLSGMLQAQRRRQFVNKANSAHNRLMGIGKRSVDPEQQALADQQALAGHQAAPLS